MPVVRRSVIITGGVVVAIIAILLIAALVTVRRPLPGYSGSVDVTGLSNKVTVLRDAQGVPQIYADDAQSLFYAQGYVQAQDRFFQMDVRRHITAGRLSELVGANQTALESDEVVRTLNWRGIAQKELPLLSGSTRNYLQAFSDGVNAYLRDRSPSELSASYVLLGTTIDLRQIETWTPVDSLSWLKAMAWDLKGNYDEELGRARAYAAVPNLSLVNELYPAYPSDSPTILSTDPAEQPLTQNASVAAALAAEGQPIPTAGGQGSTSPAASAAGSASSDADTLSFLAGHKGELAALQTALDSVGGSGNPMGVGPAVGSNSWVVSGQFTKSGKPLLANDPHLAPAMPSIWYQTGLHCRKVSSSCPFDVAGFSFAGMPGIVIGHNANISWALTNLPMDATDFFLERIVGDTYVVDGKNKPLSTRTETIRVAGASDVEITVRGTEHGPILSDVIRAVKAGGAAQPGANGNRVEGDYAVSLAWTGSEPGRSMDSLFALNQAGDWNQFRQALSMYSAPGQSFLYADTAGHIGYQAAGRAPTRNAGPGLGEADGTWPRQGWDSAYNWTGEVPFAQLPSQLDPSQGYIVAANNKVTPHSSLTQDWDYGYRAKRITQLLTEKIESGKKLTTADMTSIQTDVKDSFASDVMVPVLREAPPSDVEDTASQRAFTNEAVRLLRTWDGRLTADSAAGAYYEAVWSNLIRRTFSDELSSGVSPDGGSRTAAILRNLLKEPNSPWWDDGSTVTIVETRDQIIAQALVDARLELTAQLGKDPSSWRWGELHTLTPEQVPLGGASSPAPVRWLVNGSELRLPGDSLTVNVGFWDASSSSYQVQSIASMRMVVDLGDLNHSTWVDFTGVSGHPFSGNYGDQTNNWESGEPYPWPFTQAAVEAATSAELTLMPGQATDN